MAEVLLTVSGVIDAERRAQIERGERPRADFFEMADAFPADLIDYAQARRECGWSGRLVEKLAGPDVLLAWACFRRRKQYRLIFTDGEQVGIPLAWLLKFASWGKRPLHIMIAHILSVRKKMLFLDLFGVQSHIDRWVVYSSWQHRFIQERWGIPTARLLLTPFMVDTRFYSPDQAKPAAQASDGEPPLICASGLEARDYPTLLQAVCGLDVRLVITAASLWSKRADSTQGHDIPENVTVGRLTLQDLRQLYADSRFMVMPLHNVTFQAGVTALLEIMAMGRAVICSRAPGQTDVVVEDETGLYVPPGDAQALRKTIQRLLAHPEEAERMGQAGRQRVLSRMSLDLYVARLKALVASTLEQAQT